MQLESIIPSFIGIVIGVVITIFISWYWRPYGGRLSVQIFDYIALNARLMQNMDGIAIAYKGKPISNKMALVRGIVLNDGNRDITFDMLKQDVVISLLGGRWIDVTLGDELSRTSVLIQEDHDMRFRFGLLKVNEFIPFKALLEWSGNNIKEKDAFKKLTLRSRIANTRTEIRSPAKRISYAERFFDVAMISSFVIGVMGFLLIAATWEGRSVVTYQYESRDGNIFSGVQFKPKQDGTVDIGRIIETPRSMEFDVLETYRLDELFRTESVPVSIAVDSITRDMFLGWWIAYIAFFVIGALLLPWSIMRKRRTLKLARVLEKL